MSFRTSLFLAMRYLKPRKSFTSISMALSILGPIIGVAVLIVVVSVMNGFHQQLRQRFFSLSSHILMSRYGQPIENPAKYVEIIEKVNPAFKATPVIQAASIVQVEDKLAALDAEGKHKGKVIYHSFIGVDPKTDPNVTEIRNKCEVKNEGKVLYDFREAFDNLQDGQVICGNRFLMEHGLNIGEKVVVHPIGKLEELIEYDDDGKIKVKELEGGYVPVELSIVGAFSFDMYQFDSSLSVVTLDQAAELKGMDWNQADIIKVKTDDPFRFLDHILTLKKQPELSDFKIWSWRDENLTFFKALQTEKVMMFVLLVLIVIVSAFCVCATLITIVFQKTHEIGILKAIGADPPSIMTIFFIQGSVIGGVGVALGSLIGFFLLHIRNDFLAWLREHTSVLPPELYFFHELPAQIQGRDISIIMISTFVLCILAGGIPALMAMCIAPGKAIKAE